MKTTGISLAQLGRYFSLALAGIVFTSPATAQDDNVGLEEIVVTAQKREQNIMDVPIAITAISGAQIEESGLKDMFDLQQNVPGLIVNQSQTATTSNFSIRGIGSTSNNFGVESSVGLYVDGVYRSRQSSLINELVDVQAVEVLRGPQGTLFGKNTASGAINIRTVAPSTTETNAFIQATGGDFGLGSVSAAANIALTDNLAFRGTVFAAKRDGIADDDVFGKDVYNDRDRLGLRMQLGYENDNDFNMRIIADYAEIDEVCCTGLPRVDAIFSHGLLAQGVVQPGPGAILMSFGGTIYTDFPYPMALPPNVITGVGYEDFRTTTNKLPLSQNEDAGLSVEMNKTLSNGVTLTSVTAYRTFDTLDDIDADFTDSDIVNRINTAQQKSVSQEFRLAGEFGESSNWVAGAYYFSQTIDTNTITSGGVHLQPFVLISNPALVALMDGVDQISALTGGFIPPAADPFPAGIFADDVVAQEHDGYAVFGQIDWAMSEAVTLTLGARYTDETKDVNARYTQTNNGPPPDLAEIGLQLFYAATENPLFNPTSIFAVAEPNAGWGGYQFAPLSPRPNVTETLQDDQFTGTAKLSWFASDSSMLYVSFATGFKAGGTNTDRLFVTQSQLFNPETSTSAEVGFKGDIGDTFRLSIAAFMTDYDDFQANVFEGGGFNLRNAGKIETQGVEIEALWKLTDTITIQSYYARNEGEYASFAGASCWDATPFHTGLAQPTCDAATDTADLSGFAMAYNPEDRFFVGISKTFPMGSNEFFVRAEYTYTSESLTDGDVDPLTIQDGFGLVNLRMGVNIDSWNSNITLWGRNVTDERYYRQSFDIPLIANGLMNSYPSEPATYGITFRKNWD